MSDIKHSDEIKKKDENCFECHLGLDECIECGACEICDNDATLNEDDLPPNWLRFIEQSKNI